MFAAGNAGALAELLCGAGLGIQNFLYFHIGTFVGGGLVLDGQIQRGRHGNAGATASMPVPAAGGAGRDYLLHRASLYTLDAQADDAIPPAHWIEDCAEALAFAVIGANSLLDLDAVVVHGALSDAAIDLLLAALRRRLESDAPRDFFEPDVFRGRIGWIAPALGAGLLPLYAAYSPDLGSLLKA